MENDLENRLNGIAYKTKTRWELYKDPNTFCNEYRFWYIKDGIEHLVVCVDEDAVLIGFEEDMKDTPSFLNVVEYDVQSRIDRGEFVDV